MKIKELKELFNQLGSTSSNTDKIAILKGNKDKELFVKTLQFVYDDFIRTGVSFKSLNSKVIDFVAGEIDTDSQGEYSLESLMEYVKEHNTGTHGTIMLIQDFASMFPDEKEFIYHIFAKDIKVGITAKTINKALGKGFIREFSVQLAHPYHKYTEKVTGNEFTLTQKLDGHRSVFIVKNGKGQFYTRKGLPINGLEIQTAEAMKLAEVLGNNGSIDYVLDGELVLSNDDNLKTKDLFRATSRVLRSETVDKSRIQYNIFDALPTEEFERGKSKDTFKVRKDFLSTFMGAIAYDYPGSLNHLHLVKNLYSGSDISIIKKIQHDFVEANGWEGLMLNLNNEYYVTKRTSGLLKIKEFFDADVLVKDIFEGTGKFKGTLGGIIVDYKGYTIRIGSGFTDADREYYWNNPREIIGKIAEVNYFEETHNQKNDDISLRFPTFISVRADKDEPSYEV
ncbi:ligase [Limosilactobacillus reuteri]|uniref:ATP-dependent DNA ligase n=1 Tax=Limosilactobacillus reuteri TaxID=1598 RepID=UPI00081BECC8|nr:ligase [Limosilactobacillus reuteri]OCW71497.1 ligase [Limosilactobacillus reuteri]